MSDWTVGTEEGGVFVTAGEDKYFHGVVVDFFHSVVELEILDIDDGATMKIPKEAFTEFVRQLNDIVFPDGINSSS